MSANEEALPADSKDQEESEQRESSEREETTEPNVKVSEKLATRVSEVMMDSEEDLTIGVGDKMEAQVVCPPCICMMGDHQRDAYLLGDPTHQLDGVGGNISTTPSTTASTMATTISTTTETTSTTTTITSTTTNSPTKQASGCESDLSAGELCLSESCVMAAGAILTSLDRR